MKLHVFCSRVCGLQNGVLALSRRWQHWFSYRSEACEDDVTPSALHYSRRHDVLLVGDMLNNQILVRLSARTHTKLVHAGFAVRLFTLTQSAKYPVSFFTQLASSQRKLSPAPAADRAQASHDQSSK